MTININIPIEHYLKVETILDDLGIHVAYDKNGNIYETDFLGSRFDPSFDRLNQIAPYVSDGSYFEDMYEYYGTLVRWTFHGGQCYQLQPQIVWPEPWNEKANTGQPVRLTAEQIRSLKEMYQPGVSIRLISMYEEPQMPSGMMGTVTFVDDIGQIHTAWANGSSLALNCGVDKFIAFTGPSAGEYLREKLSLSEATTIWYREDSNNCIAAAVDADKLIFEAERYMEKTISISQDLAVAMCKPYETETIFDVFLSAHVLTGDDVMRIKQKTEYTKSESEAERCPKCGSDNLSYEAAELGDGAYVDYPWVCNECGSAGIEYGAIEFDGHLVKSSPGFDKFEEAEDE